MEPPLSDKIQFSIRENNWLDGLSRAMQEALARLCAQNINQIIGTCFVHYARRDSMGQPLSMPAHPKLMHHVDHMDFMLHETQKELDNAHDHAKQSNAEAVERKETLAILTKERKSLHSQLNKKDRIIACLRQKIATLEETIHDQEIQLDEQHEEEGEDIQGIFTLTSVMTMTIWRTSPWRTTLMRMMLISLMMRSPIPPMMSSRS